MKKQLLTIAPPPQINGERTLGENIADNGGIREAFMAYQMYVDKFGREQTLPGFENFTAEQLFFLSFGNVSRNKSVTATITIQLTIDLH